MKTNKENLREALRNIHYATGYIMATDVSSKDNADIRRNTALQNLHFAEQSVLSLMETNELQ